MDLSNEEEQKKFKICAFLVATIGLCAFLYGKKVLVSKEKDTAKEEKVNKSVQVFIEQAKEIIKKIAPTAYTTIVTFLVSKKILRAEESVEIFGEYQEVPFEEENKEGENETESSKEEPSAVED